MELAYPSRALLFAVCLILILFASAEYCSAAREYKPVDQLGHGSSYRLPAPKKAAAPSRTHSKAASAPISSKSYRTPTGAIKLFGTQELKFILKSPESWLDVLNRNKQDPVFDAARHFNKSTTWANLRDKAESKSQMEQLRLINSFWNGWPYKEDLKNWGKPDYWAIPAQFIKKSGDCEDYAITKYFTLKELGFDPKKMRIVVLHDVVRNLDHAVLAVYLNDEVYILDNLSNAVLTHQQLGNYSPAYSVNEHYRWAHINK